MKLFEYAWVADFYDKISDLKSLAMDEDWDYKKHPTGKTQYWLTMLNIPLKNCMMKGKYMNKKNIPVLIQG